VKEVPERPWLHPELADPDGLAGVGGDLSATMLLLAYSDGVFPWFNDDDPVLWWSPDPRAIFELDHIHVSRRLARTIRQGKFVITVDHCFETVMRCCGGSRPEGTWITESMVKAFTALHRFGHAHSVEVWQDGELAGGIYGVSIGAFFSAESMFFHRRDASKVALVHLALRLKQRGFDLLDTQMTTDHTRSLGATEITRTQYLKRLKAAVSRSEVKFA
jgi:leucyl/phenylalanyl-tRNA--protein transferase